MAMRSALLQLSDSVGAGILGLNRSCWGASTSFRSSQDAWLGHRYFSAYNGESLLRSLQLSKNLAAPSTQSPAAARAFRCWPGMGGTVISLRGHKSLFESGKMPSIEYRRDENGFNLSGQMLTGEHLHQISEKLYTVKVDAEYFEVNLSLNSLELQDVDMLIALLEKFNWLQLNLADNNFSWPELRRNLETRADARKCLRWLAEGRIRMASTIFHSKLDTVIGELGKLLSSAFKDLEKLVDRNAKMNKWLMNESLAIEDEVNEVVCKHYTMAGYTVSNLSDSSSEFAGYAVLRKDGRHAYSFDGAFVVSKGGVTSVVLGEVKHNLTCRDIDECTRKVDKFITRLKKVADKSIDESGTVFKFRQQLKSQEMLVGLAINVYVGGVRILPEAMKYAARKGYNVVVTNGSRYNVLSAEEAAIWQVNVPPVIVEEEEEE